MRERKTDKERHRETNIQTDGKKQINKTKTNIHTNYHMICTHISYKPALDEYKKWCIEDRQEFDAIIQEARDNGATEEMIKELGTYTRENNVYDDQAEWVSTCTHR